MARESLFAGLTYAFDVLSAAGVANPPEPMDDGNREELTYLRQACRDGARAVDWLGAELPPG